MTDDEIRDLLATLAAHTMGLPMDQVAVGFGQVEANGGDVAEVRVWVETHGGRVDDPPESDALRLRADRSMAPVSPDRRRFIIPASALGL